MTTSTCYINLLQCDDDMHHRWTRCSMMMTCFIGRLAAVWWWHTLYYLQCDDDMHHHCTRCSMMMTCITDGMHHGWTCCSVMMTCITVALAPVWWWRASLMDSLQCVDNMHHYGNNIIKGLATAFQLLAGKSWGRYLKSHLFCYGNNRPGGGSLSATLEF